MVWYADYPDVQGEFRKNVIKYIKECEKWGKEVGIVQKVTRE